MQQENITFALGDVLDGNIPPSCMKHYPAIKQFLQVSDMHMCASICA